MLYHVLVVPCEHPTDVAYSLDLTEEQVLERVKAPYESGGPLLVSGRTFQAEEIKKVQVSRTNDPSAVVLPDVRRVLSSSHGIVNQLMPAQRWMITDGRFSDDVTDQFLTSPMPLARARARDNTAVEERAESWVWPLASGAASAILVGTILQAIELLPLWLSGILTGVVFALVVGAYGYVRHRRQSR